MPLPEITTDQLLTVFRAYLENETTFPRMARELAVKPAQLRDAIRNAFQDGAIVLQTPEVRSLRDRLNETWAGPRYHVLRATDDSFFFDGAAAVFLAELGDMLAQRDMTLPLNIGIVSGQTTGGMIESLCSLTWSQHLRRDLLPPAINVFALNVSQTSGFKQLRGNANVLTYQLARKFQEECEQGTKIEAFGLSTELLQTIDERNKSDIRPQTRSVLKVTDPARLRKSLSLTNDDERVDIPDKSSLDVVVTGVGTIDDSLFRDYCKYYDVDIDHLRRVQHIVGDIAYCPVTRVGEYRHLVKDDSEYLFYTAVSLDVLEQISLDRGKRVFLIARNSSGRDKIDPMHAAIAGARQFCNVFITDNFTGDKLYKTMAIR